MKKSEKGITLIAVIVTVVVLLILAGVAILTLTGENGIIGKSKETTFKTDISTYQEELRISIAEDYLDKQGKRTDNNKFNAEGYDNIIRIVPSFNKKYEDKLAIKNDELVYIGFDELERKWMSELEMKLENILTINYINTAGNKIAEPYTTTVPNKKYSVISPEIEGYMPAKEIVEGELTEDTEITVEYYAIANELYFVGIDMNGNETTNETDIIAYTVSGIGNCYNSKIAIPTEHNGKPVTEISTKAFMGEVNIVGIIIPTSVETIRNEAFSGCSNLSFANINSKTLERQVFAGCRNLENVKLGKTTTSIGILSFGNCTKLNTIEIYSENITLNSYYFRGCSSLKEIIVNEDNNSYKSIDGVMYSKDGSILIRYPNAKEGDFIIPEEVTEIGPYAFDYNYSLSKIKIPTTVSKVKNNAFEQCQNLIEADIGAQAIYQNAFLWCKKLEKIYLKERVYNVQQCFNGCTNLSTIEVYSEKIILNSYPFRGCTSFKEIIVNEDNSSYKSVDGVMYSKDGSILICYPNAKEGDFIIPEGVTEIESYAFDYNYSLSKIEIPNTVKVIKNNAFEGCFKVTNIKIPSSVINIGNNAFYSWTSSQTIDIQGYTSAPSGWSSSWNQNCHAKINWNQ